MVAAKRAAALFVLAIGAGPDPIDVAAEADGEGAVVSPAAPLRPGDLGLSLGAVLSRFRVP
jgi:hypothetical protein